jgi:hypothetical protein
MPPACLRRCVSVAFVAGLLMILPFAAGAQAPSSQQDHLIAPDAFARLLPTVAGWTKTEGGTGTIDLSDCSYSYASARYTKNEARAKLTLADTGGHQDSLMALAASVMVLPEGHSEVIPPASTVARVKLGEHQAAEMWDGAKLAGEIVVVIGNRFVVSVEAAKVDGLDPIREILAAVDLKAIAVLANR